MPTLMPLPKACFRCTAVPQESRHLFLRNDKSDDRCPPPAQHERNQWVDLTCWGKWNLPAPLQL